MRKKDETQDHQRAQKYLSSRLEECTKELVRLDLLDLNLTRQKKQAIAAFNFIRVMQEKIQRAFTVNELYSNVVKALISDLYMDSSALLKMNFKTGDVSVLVSAGLPENIEVHKIEKNISKKELLNPTFVNSRSSVKPFHKWIRKNFETPYFVWYPVSVEEEDTLFLFVGNKLEDYVTKQPFSEESLEAFGAISSVILLRKDNIAKTQEILRKKEERIDFLAKIIKTSTISVIATDKYEKITYVNPATEKLYGYQAKELIGKKLRFLNAEPKSAEIQKEIIETVRQGKVWRGEILNRKKNGDLFYIHATINRLVNREGNLSTMVGFQEDITEQKKMEEERIKADKIESLGILAGGIAHDFNNILTSILGNISLAKLVSDKDDKSHDLLNDAEKASLRAKDLTNQLLTFSKGGAPVKKTASIQQIIEDTARFSLRGSNVKCCNFIPKNLWFVKVDVGQISQVISNLVINAYQAMPAGGVINIKAENIIVGPESLLPLNQGKYVKISIRDQGTGITRKYLSKIFDPYFTTKQKSSGLGLATAYSILKKHAGHIAVESELEVGTTFHVYLPASADKFRGNEPVKEEIPVRKSKVLIMDDDEAVRVTATRIIKKIGHEVAVSADGAEAMELYINARESNRPYDIVILDLTVPGGMGGREAVKQLLKIDPQVKAIVSSGYSTDPVLSNFAEYGFSGIITKPYNVEEMRELLNKVTGDSGD